MSINPVKLVDWLVDFRSPLTNPQYRLINYQKTLTFHLAKLMSWRQPADNLTALDFFCRSPINTW